MEKILLLTIYIMGYCFAKLEQEFYLQNKVNKYWVWVIRIIGILLAYYYIYSGIIYDLNYLLTSIGGVLLGVFLIKLFSKK